MNTQVIVVENSNIVANVEIPKKLKVTTDVTPPANHGMFRILTKEDGDKRVVWNKDSFDEIREAKAMFDKLVAEGLCPYKVGTNGQATSAVMTEFDPYAEEILFLPIRQVVGG